MTDIIYQNEVPYPEILWERPVHYYKHEAGRVFMLAGSGGTPKTAILTSEIIFRSGTGVLTLGFPEGMRSIYSPIFSESMMLALPQTPAGSISKKAHSLIIEQVEASSVFVIGTDISTNAETIQLIWDLIFEISKPIILTSEGVKSLILGINVLRSREPSEFLNEYFLKKSAGLIIVLNNGNLHALSAAMDLSDIKHKMALVEKGKRLEETLAVIAATLRATIVFCESKLIIATPSGQIIINGGDSPDIYQLKTDDIVAGVLGSFVAQNPKKTLEAIRTAIYIFGSTLSLCTEKILNRDITMSDIIRFLPEAIKKSEDSD
jgi:NAD(P)H-hydrate repair Nnr-like enzyme with NAD(P)H-hydrate dehydratase domain